MTMLLRAFLIAFSVGALSCGGQSTHPSPGEAGPDPVDDLVVSSREDTALTLAWTVPQSSDPTLTYELRSSVSPMIEEDWKECEAVAALVSQKPAGAEESLRIPGLPPATRRCFALKVTDADGRSSAISNVTVGITSGVRMVAPHVQRSPSWSPDGTRIAYAWQSGIDVVSADGGDLARVLDGRVAGLSWSPNGRELAFGRYTGDSLAIVAVDGGTVTLVALGAGMSPAQPAWGPAGDRIAFVAGDLLRFIAIGPASGGEARRLTFNQGNVGDPAWSPDGTSIAYVVRDGNDVGLWVCPIRSGQTLRLFDGRALCPTYAPDGTRIAFIALSGDKSEIRIIPAGGGDAVALPVPENPEARNPRSVAWSPDGLRIAFVSEDEILWGYTLTDE